LPPATAVGPDAARTCWRVRDYDLEATLNSGQAFRWLQRDGGWEGVVGARWVRLVPDGDILAAQAALPQPDWRWLEHYLQLDANLDRILATLPADPPLAQALAACRGLRLLRQDPWECLASFLLSSTKQIVQIRQIVARLCERFGEPVPAPTGAAPAWQFPTPQRLAACRESEIRACQAGFRAPYLLAAAQRVATGALELAGLARLPLAGAREQLMALPGVGRKIADCVLLFACGFQQAFPVDVWVERTLREWFFPGSKPPPRVVRAFGETHFGPYGGYAQQYLFHWRRVHSRPSPSGG
jgi:N-glycosylase/DNA lyase